MKKQNGFGAVEVILGIVVVALVGVIAYLGIQSLQKKQDSETSSIKATDAATQPAAEASLSIDDAVGRLKAAGFTVTDKGENDYKSTEGTVAGKTLSLDNETVRIDLVTFTSADKAKADAAKLTTTDGPVFYAIGTLEVGITNDINTGSERVDDTTIQKIKTTLK